MSRVVRRGLKEAAVAADVLRGTRPPGLVVLIYHRVGRRTDVEVDLPVGLFEEQVAFLAEQAETVTLGDGLTEVARASEPRPLVAVTFDDGTADFAEVALPVLTHYRMPVTLYVSTAFVDEGRPFPDDGRPLSWAALHDACSTGIVDVGSHTHTHALLDRLPPDVVTSELDRSIALLGDRLGIPVRDFAYPKAVPGSPAARDAVRARFRSAALAGTRPNPFGATNPWRLARSPVQLGDGMRFFAHKVQGGMAVEDVARSTVNRLRYARARS